jgi:hypothetical protein
MIRWGERTSSSTVPNHELKLIAFHFTWLITLFNLYSLINGDWKLVESSRFEQPLLDIMNDLFILTGGTGCFSVTQVCS